MPENHQTDQVQNGAVTPEDEIELIDLLRVIWKWKYLIIGGTAVCALAAIIISFNMQKIYRVSLVLKPGVNKIAADGTSVYLYTVADIKSIIESELKFKILDHLKNTNQNEVSSSWEYKISANNNINTLSILYDTPNPDEGIKRLNYLTKVIAQRYDENLKYIQNQYDIDETIAKKKLALKGNDEDFIKSKIIDIQKRLDEFTQKMGTKEDFPESQTKSQNTLFDYASTVQVVMNLRQTHSDIILQIDSLKKQVAELENQKIRGRAIQVVQPPTSSQYPINPDKRRNVMLAAIVGLFMMLLISVCLEYISRNKMQKAL